MSELRPASQPAKKKLDLPHSIHLRIAQSDITRLETYASRLSRERQAKVGLSEAVRELLDQALNRQEDQPWEVALKALPFVTWSGGKPELPPLDLQPDGISLARIVLEDRGPS
jgi:sigma54-dependent transcription regulator